MKKLITSTLFLICASITVAQTTTDDYYQAPKHNFLSKDKVSGSVSMGAGVSFLNSTKNTSYTTFVATKIGYQLTNKFKLSFGLMHYTSPINPYFNMNASEVYFPGSNKSIFENLLFAEGQYQLNKKLMMSGSVIADVNSFSNKQNNYKAISLGMDYKVSEHSTIGIRTTISQGETPYYNTHMGNYNFGSTTPPMQDMFVGFGQDFTRGLNSVIR